MKEFLKLADEGCIDVVRASRRAPSSSLGQALRSAPQSLQMYPDNPDQRSLPRRRPGSMSPRHEPVRMHKSLLIHEKFESCGKMGPGLRREGDQKYASIPILSQPLSMRYV